jgi:hypothetical protein
MYLLFTQCLADQRLSHQTLNLHPKRTLRCWAPICTSIYNIKSYIENTLIYIFAFKSCRYINIRVLLTQCTMLSLVFCLCCLSWACEGGGDHKESSLESIPSLQKVVNRPSKKGTLSSRRGAVGHEMAVHINAEIKDHTFSTRYVKHTPYKTDESAHAGFSVQELLIATEVRHRRPLGVGTRFKSSVGSLWSMALVRNDGGERTLQMRWWRGDELKGTFDFSVGRGLRWKEWSNVIIQPTDIGQWSVEVFDPLTQQLLKRHTFEIFSSAVASEVTASKSPILQPLVAKNHQKDQEMTRSLDALTQPSITPKARTAAQVETQAETQHLQETMKQAEKTQRGRKKLKSAPYFSKMIKPTRSSNVLDSHGEKALSPLKVNRLSIAREVRHRRPLGVSSRFSRQIERIWGYIEVQNEAEHQWVWMEWWHDDQRRSRLRVRIGQSKRWRTWSWQRMSPRDIGLWEVKVLSSTLEELARAQFLIED